MLSKECDGVGKMLEAIRADDYVELAGNLALLRVPELVLREYPSRLGDGPLCKVDSDRMAARERLSQHIDAVAERATPVQNACFPQGKVLIFRGRETFDESPHEIGGLVTAAIFIPLPGKVVFPPRTRIDRRLRSAHKSTRHPCKGCAR